MHEEDFDLLDAAHLSPRWQDEDDPPCKLEPLTPWHEEENWRQDLHVAIKRLQVEMAEKRKKHELIQDMHDRIVTLEDAVSRLPQCGSVIVLLTTLAPEPFDLLREIKIVLEPVDDDEFIASFFDANLNAQGCNQQEAFDNLKETILSRFEYLDTLDPAKLGPAPAKQIAILREYIRRRV